MRYLILSDIHANWEALEAVVAHAAGEYDEVLCCGDLVGYGADPDRVVEWVRSHCRAVVRGNHDRASCGLEDPEWFNPVAKQAALWTLHNISVETFAYIRALAQGPLLHDGMQLIHGAPFDEDEYVASATEASEAFTYVERRLAFFGHTHLQGGFVWNQSRVETLGRPEGRSERQRLELDPECAYLINPGSVGQPRDGDPRAAYVLYDAAEPRLWYRRAPYDIAEAQRKIRDAGLPPVLADRLSLGR